MKITRLSQPAGTIFVEYHSVFHEPKGWFDGENLLRAKLPTIAQFQVQQFRGKLARASLDKDAGCRNESVAFHSLRDMNNCRMYQNSRATEANSASEAATCWPMR